ncbi:hypothetical protein HYC85_016841 [Camellia sinensis]|uniref:ABC transporter domain-containing protein n=1 Tax=Camellia sinensis TaxID=4442 RepID=A0A7J7H0T0_CAMSI|nr:hypothetical protein HYC85_016841 [Camellia sinensis]
MISSLKPLDRSHGMTWNSVFKGSRRTKALKVRYNENLPMVLHGITCTFPGEKKIGIVGRTGNGKSTLIQAFRLSIIPQDPNLFDGTIRGNLDPLHEHSDQEIWQALEKSQLGDIVRRKEKKLDTPDNLIQKIIQTEFRDCTVCTIAHRIPTVIYSDLVLVLSDGAMYFWIVRLPNQAAKFFKVGVEVSLFFVP